MGDIGAPPQFCLNRSNLSAAVALVAPATGIGLSTRGDKNCDAEGIRKAAGGGRQRQSHSGQRRRQREPSGKRIQAVADAQERDSVRRHERTMPATALAPAIGNALNPSRNETGTGPSRSIALSPTEARTE